MMIGGVDTNRKYRADEIVQMYKDGRLRDVALKGYVSRANADGTCEFVHWTKANRMTGDPDHKPGVYTANYDLVGELQKGLPPIEKRTPQQRVASLMLKVLAQGQTGLSDEMLQEILGESWKAGTPLSAEEVRRVAAHFLQAAEIDAKKNERSQSAKANRKQRREQERLERLERREWERLRRQSQM